jgi:hypothetical protein
MIVSQKTRDLPAVLSDGGFIADFDSPKHFALTSTNLKR